MSEEVEIVEMPSDDENNSSETFVENEDLESDSTTEEESQDDADEAEENGEEVKRKSNLDKRFGKLTKEKHQLATELAHWKAEALKNSQGQATTPKQAPVVNTVDREPRLEDTNDYTQYAKDLARWTYRQEHAQAQQQVQAQAAISSYKTRVSEFSKEQPDYEDVIASTNDWQVPSEINEIILTSDVGPQIAYHLGTNEEEFLRLAGMSPLQRAKELGKLEAIFEKSTAKATPKTVSKAPSAIKPVSGNRAVATTDLSDASLANDYQAWKKARQGQMKKKK